MDNILPFKKKDKPEIKVESEEIVDDLPVFMSEERKKKLEIARQQKNEAVKAAYKLTDGK